MIRLDEALEGSAAESAGLKAWMRTVAAGPSFCWIGDGAGVLGPANGLIPVDGDEEPLPSFKCRGGVEMRLDPNPGPIGDGGEGEWLIAAVEDVDPARLLVVNIEVGQRKGGNGPLATKGRPSTATAMCGPGSGWTSVTAGMALTGGSFQKV